MADVSWPLCSESSSLGSGKRQSRRADVKRLLAHKELLHSQGWLRGDVRARVSGYFFSQRVPELALVSRLSSYVLLTGRLPLQVAVIICLPTGQAQPLSQRPVKYRLLALMKGSRWGNHRNSTPPKTATFFKVSVR